MLGLDVFTVNNVDDNYIIVQDVCEDLMTV